MICFSAFQYHMILSAGLILQEVSGRAMLFQGKWVDYHLHVSAGTNLSGSQQTAGSKLRGDIDGLPQLSSELAVNGWLIGGSTVWPQVCINSRYKPKTTCRNHQLTVKPNIRGPRMYSFVL